MLRGTLAPAGHGKRQWNRTGRSAPVPFNARDCLSRTACRASIGAEAEGPLSRREVMLGVSGLGLALSTVPSASADPAPAPADIVEGVGSVGKQFAELYDETLAYKFLYPVATTSGKPLKMVLSHPPEKYSSAAPLTADARQRIVCELLDLRNFVSVSMTVGPASGVLKNAPPQEWKPYDVALTVLIDRSTSRLTTGQRFALNDVERAVVEERDDGQRYFVFEHLAQGSPTVADTRTSETFRHALAVTAVRPDSAGRPFMYTLNLACRQAMWDELEPLFKEAVAAYRLVPPTQRYIAPDVNPWQFW